jgi:hypothetical protein
VGLERGPFSTNEELLGIKCSGSGIESRDYGRRGSAALTTRHPSIRISSHYTSPTSGGRSVGIVRSRTQAMEFSQEQETNLAPSSGNYGDSPEDGGRRCAAGAQSDTAISIPCGSSSNGAGNGRMAGG